MGMWSKAEREKLEKELDLCLDVFLYVMEFKANDVLRAALDNIKDVMKELRDIISSKSADDKDVSSIIKECRSKVLNQIQYICDNNVSYNQAFVHFKSEIQEAHLNADNDTTTTAKGGTSKKKGKAPQLTKLQLQQQRDDEKKLNVCLEKQAAVKQLTWDYQMTLQFIQRFVFGKEATHKDSILIDAFHNIANAFRDLDNFYGYDSYEEEDKWYHLDVSRMIKEYKSKVEKELKEVCDKASHPTIKEAFTRHLADVKAGGTIPAQNHRPHLHNKDEKRMSTKQKMSFKKRSRLLMGRHALISVPPKPPLFLEHHRHSQFCFRNNYFDRMYGHLRKSPPKEEEYSEKYLEEDSEL